MLTAILGNIEFASEASSLEEVAPLLAEVRRTAERSLRRHGYWVRSVATAEEALQTLTTEPPFALLVTDVMLPGMSGRELSRQLAEHSPELRCCSSPATRRA